MASVTAAILHPASGGSFGGRGPWSDRAERPATYSSSTPSLAWRSSRPPRLMSPRPTNAIGNCSRSPKMPASMSTYFGDAMLPSSTTSHSGPISASSARALASSGRRYVALSASMSPRANARTAAWVIERVRAAQPGIRRDDVDAAADDGIVRLGRPREPARVGQLAAEVQAADEGEEIAERRALRRAQRRRERERRIRRQRLLRAAAAAVGGREQEDRQTLQVLDYD